MSGWGAMTVKISNNIWPIAAVILLASSSGWALEDADGEADSSSLVVTESTTTTNSTVNSTNTNTNTNNNTVNSTSTSTNTNNNVLSGGTNNTNTNINTNNNILSGGTDNKNTNINTNTNNSTINQTTNNTSNSTINNTTNSTIDQTTDSTINQTTDSTIDQTVDQTVNSTNTNTNTNNNTNVNTSTSNNTNTNNNNNKSDVTQTIKSPPPSAIAPTVNAGGNDTCTVSYSAAVQSQVLGIAGGGHVRDLNCERLKNSKQLYNMGMKVAAVSLMCQDPKVFTAMEMAGTPCPFNGKIGEEAKEMWAKYPELKPTEQEEETRRNDTLKGIGWGILGSALLMYATGGAAF